MNKMNAHIQTVELAKAYRLLNHGPTVLVSAKYEQEINVMSAAWACALELVPAKVSVVLGRVINYLEENHLVPIILL